MIDLFKLTITALLMIFVASCSTGHKEKLRPESPAPQVSDTYGPPIPEGAIIESPDADEGTYGPEPVQIRPVVLVLGPGLARAFAYAGVLRALDEARIPIGAIVGTEVGALMAAIYGHSPTIHRFDWAVAQIKGTHFDTRAGVFGAFKRGPTDGRELMDALKTIFGSADLRDAKLPVLALAHSNRSNESLILRDGSSAEITRAALATSFLFEPILIDGVAWHAAVASRPFAVSEAKALGIGPVVAVNVLDGARPQEGMTPAQRGAQLELITALKGGAVDLAEADLVITPDLTGIGYFDFTRRTDTVFRGKKAVQKKLQEIRHLVGLPRIPTGDSP